MVLPVDGGAPGRDASSALNPSVEAEYRTLTRAFRGEIEVIKGSRFLALASPVADEDDAARHLSATRAEFPDASHHCQAWRLRGPGDRFRASDDGEPSGSAGRPVLQQIDGHGVVDVSVIVVRWFGGTKLGVGGLMRAYGGAAGHALDEAPIATVLVKRRVEVHHPYACSGPVQGLLAAWDLEPREAAYGEDVALVFDIPLRDVDRFASEITDCTAGQARVQVE